MTDTIREREGKLPREVTEAQKALYKAWEAYRKARQAHNEAGEAYYQAWEAYRKALRDHKDEKEHR